MESFRVVTTGLRSPEGPVALPDGSVAFVESMASRVSRVAPDGEVTTVAETGDGPNGMALDGVGTLLVANNGGLGHPVRRPGRLQRISSDGEVVDLATGLDAPNDVCVAPDGVVWFTDPRDSWYLDVLRPGRVYRWDGRAAIVDHEGFDYPNGIGCSPAGVLVVAESRTGVLHRREAGTWTPWVSIPEGAPDGFAFDAEGRCFVCCFDTGRIVVVEPEGRVSDTIALGDDTMPTNCAIAADGALYVTESAGGRLLALPLGLATPSTSGGRP